MKKEDISNSIMLYWEDHRIPKEARDELKKLPMCTIYCYATSNIYICNFGNCIKSEVRAFMKVKKAKGEHMHRALHKSVNKHAAVLYDKLLNGFSTGKNAMAPMTFNEEDVLY